MQHEEYDSDDSVGIASHQRSPRVPHNGKKASFFDDNSDNDNSNRSNSIGMRSMDLELSDYEGESGSTIGTPIPEALDLDEDIWLAHIESLPFWTLPLIRLCFLLFTVGVAITVALPSMEVIFYKLACQKIVKDSGGSLSQEQCDPKETQHIVSTYLMWDMLFGLAVGLVVCTKVSALSDIHGRKPFLAAFMILLFFNWTSKYFLIVTTDSFPMWGMWITSTIGSLSGGVMALVALFKAYLTDVTRPSSRVTAMGYTAIAFSLGQIIGPLLASYVLTQARKGGTGLYEKLNDGTMVPALELIPIKILIVLLALALLFCLVLLPELRPRRIRTKARSALISLLLANTTSLPSIWRRIPNGIKGFFAPIRLLTFPTELRNDNNASIFHSLRICVFSLSLIDIMLNCIVILIYLIEPQFCIYEFKWDSIKLSNFTVAKAIVNIGGVGLLLPSLYKYVFPRTKRLAPQPDTFDTADTSVVVFGLVSMALTQLGASLSSSSGIYVAISVISSFMALHGPVLSSAPVKYFPNSRVGEYYGAMALTQGIMNMFTPFVVTSLYKYGVEKGFPGLPYVFNSMLALISVGFAVRARRSVSDNATIALLSLDVQNLCCEA